MILPKPKHEHFAQLMAKGATATEAAQIVGYSKKAARKQGSRLWTNVDIQARVRELQKEIAEAAIFASGISKAWVIQGLKENLERAMAIRPAVDKKSRRRRAVFIYNGAAANRALELIGKELGMFTDRIEHREGPITLKVVL